MKYRDLKLSFLIADTRFDIISISQEKIVKPYPRHAHSKNSYELHFVPEGKGTLIVNNTKYDIEPGTLFMTGPEIPHEQISSHDNPMTEYSIYLQTAQESSTPSAQIIQTFLNCTFWFGKAQASLYAQLEQLFLELRQRQSGYDLMVKSILQQIIINVSRHYLGNKKTQKEEALLQQQHFINEKAYLIIEEAFLYDYKTITLEELAERVSLGKRQTERLLKKHYASTFHQKKAEARMSAATQLLAESTLSISEIAEDLGYASPEHFSNAFKKYYGITATAYRRSACCNISCDKKN